MITKQFNAQLSLLATPEETGQVLDKLTKNFPQVTFAVSRHIEERRDKNGFEVWLKIVPINIEASRYLLSFEEAVENLRKEGFAFTTAQ